MRQVPSPSAGHFFATGKHHRAHASGLLAAMRPWWRESADQQVNAPLSCGTCHPALPTSPRSASTTRSRCSRSSFARTSSHADAATLRGLERRFAERVQIQPSYWSQIKSRSRQIGERLARQFEQLCHKPYGWMDLPHGPASPLPRRTESAPRDDDERFIVGLVLTYYRRHPQRARTRLLDLLGEVLTPQPDTGTPAPSDDGDALWQRTRSGVAPLRRKR